MRSIGALVAVAERDYREGQVRVVTAMAARGAGRGEALV
jgi:hypothetical protein